MVRQISPRAIVLFLILSSSISFAQVQIESYRIPSGTFNQGLWQSLVLPQINGITISVDWATVDNCSTALPCAYPGTGTSYDWSVIDNVVTPYTISSFCLGGTKVCLINFEINAASGGIGSTAHNSATPSYVFLNSWASTCCGTSPPVDVCFCPNYPGNMHTATGCQAPQPPTDTTGVPAGWEQPFVAAYELFIGAMVNHYNSISTGGYKVGYIRWGIGTGGGGVIPCPTQEMNPAPPTGTGPTIPLTLGVWQSYANTIFAYAQSTTPTMLMEGSGYGDPTDIGVAYSDAVASAAILHGAGSGAESLALHDQLLYASGAPCSNDWCNIFNTYALQAPMLGLQTVNPSDPSCTTDPGRGSTCSLIFVLPFSTQRHASVLEIANGDLMCAFATGYNLAPCLNGGTYQAPYPPYTSAIQNAALGVPSSTSAMNGKAVVSGATLLP